jgi:hypothetical protein
VASTHSTQNKNPDPCRPVMMGNLDPQVAIPTGFPTGIPVVSRGLPGLVLSLNCGRQKFCNQLVLFITTHKLKIFPRCKVQICSLEYTISDGIRVHTTCAKTWSVRGLSR